MLKTYLIMSLIANYLYLFLIGYLVFKMFKEKKIINNELSDKIIKLYDKEDQNEINKIDEAIIVITDDDIKKVINEMRNNEKDM